MNEALFGAAPDSAITDSAITDSAITDSAITDSAITGSAITGSTATDTDATRGFDIEEDPGLFLGAPNNPGSEHYLEGEGDLLFASATSASRNAMDANSYTQAVVATQQAHPEWTLHEVIREVNAQNVNGTGSELAVTDEASAEAGRDVGFKSALVVGNEKYQHHPQLGGAAGDAASMANMLAGQGYEVEHVTDRSGVQLESDLKEAGLGLGDGDEMLLYYAGHGFQRGLLGVDTPKNAASGVVPTASVLESAGRLKSAGVKTEVVLDSCKSGSQVDELVARDGVEAGVEELRALGQPLEAGPELGSDIQTA